MAKLSGTIALVALGLGFLAAVNAGGLFFSRSGGGGYGGGWGGWAPAPVAPPQEGWGPPKVIEHHRHVYKVHNHDSHEHKVLEHDHHQHKLHEYNQHKKIINRDHVHKHNLHIHNIHRHLLNRHKIHEHNVHKHNLHVTHVLEPVIHTYHKTEQKVHPYVQEEHKVIPHHETVYKQHEHHVKGEPVVIEHKGWGQEEPAAVAPQAGWGWQGAPAGPVEEGGYHRRSDINVAEPSAPVAIVAKPEKAILDIQPAEEIVVPAALL